MTGAVESLLAIAATCAGPWIFFQGFRTLRVQRLIEDTPTSNIGSMAMGLVEVQGAVTPRSRVSAPFSGRSCAYWQVEIATRSDRNGKGLGEWTTVHRNHSGHPFFLQDQTGVALVYPQGADVRLPFGVEEQTGGLGVPDLYMDYMKASGLTLRAVWALGPMRFRERSLEEGAAMFVIGRAHPKAMAQSISDDEVEMAATGTYGGAKSVAGLDARSNGVIRRADGDPLFVISTQSEKQMSAEFGLRAFAGLVGGPLLTLAGAWFLMLLIQSGRFFGN